MYLYYNKEGTLKTNIPHGQPVRQGDNLDLYVCLDTDFFTLRNPNNMANWVLNVDIIYPNGNRMGNVVGDSPSTSVFHKTFDSEITYDLVNGKRYIMYHINISAANATQYYGINVATIKLLTSTLVVDEIVFGNANIYVEKTVGYSIPPAITDEDYYDTINEEINELTEKINVTDSKSFEIITLNSPSGTITSEDERTIINDKPNRVIFSLNNYLYYYNNDGNYISFIGNLRYDKIAINYETFEYVYTQNIESVESIIAQSNSDLLITSGAVFNSVSEGIITAENYTNQIKDEILATKATTTTLGMVKIGDNISVDNEGRISSTASASVNIVDNLTSTDANKALSANQGKVLNDNKLEKNGDVANGLTIHNGLATSDIDTGDTGIVNRHELTNSTILKVDKVLGDNYPNISGNGLNDTDLIYIDSGGTAKKTTIGDLKTAIGFSEHFKGEYTSLQALQTVYPTANDGDYAYVAVGSGEDENIVLYVWDDDPSPGAWKQTNVSQYASQVDFDNYKIQVANGTAVAGKADDYTANGPIAQTFIDNIGKINQLSFNATYDSANKLITANISTIRTLSHNVTYYIDVILPVSVASGLLPYDVEIEFKNNTDTIRLNGVFNRDGSQNAKFGQILPLMDKYDNEIGFRWNFEATYKTSGSNKVFDVSPTVINTQNQIIAISNSIMADAVDSSNDAYGCYAVGQLVTPSDDDGYIEGHIFKYVNIGNIANPVYDWQDMTVIPQATLNSIGGIKAATRDDQVDVNEVKIDTSSGKLYVQGGFPNIILEVVNFNNVTTSEVNLIAVKLNALVDGMTHKLKQDFTNIMLSSPSRTFICSAIAYDYESADGLFTLRFTIDGSYDYELVYATDANTVTITTKVTQVPSSLNNITVSNWVSDSTYTGFPYRALITYNGATTNSVLDVTFPLELAQSGNYAPVTQSVINGVYIYSKVNTSISGITVVMVVK